MVRNPRSGPTQSGNVDGSEQPGGRRVKNKISSAIYYTSGVVILGYLLYSTGPANIIETTLSTRLTSLIGALALTLLAAGGRYYKLNLLLPNYRALDVFSIFLFSRLGKEFSYVGHFTPLLKKSYRSVDTAENLIVDRYTEVLATSILGSIACVMFFRSESLYYLIVAMIMGAFVVLCALPFVSIAKYSFKTVLLSRAAASISKIQSQLHFDRPFLVLMAFSIVVTMLDFYVVAVILGSFDVSIDFVVIPIVWASSAIVAVATFIFMGTTEYSILYLYERYASIGHATTLSYLIASRVVNFLSILGMALLYYGLELSSRSRMTPK